ncbi:helix-turn-helix transcriptional regulator [Neobacillus sp. YIM B02564]|uniref:Helix-turn-helix transcriptional regulator n=1 Tax=Neobacillus paridis TaxID=2803862 RepID=A0ABS1TNF1_9BACI|nr:helix-turn-helix transcriptional regulator [Neobacillus paridis]MBL4952093.1 helix-turn-helix transcriptional regulator [Neobacillus paridis]
MVPKKPTKTPTERAQETFRLVETGEFLRKKRNQLGLSMQQVGDILHISTNYVSEIERGVKLPSPLLIRELAYFYHINENDLFRMYGKIPLSAKEELEANTFLQDLLSDINQNKNLPDKKKKELFSEFLQVYQRFLKDYE